MTFGSDDGSSSVSSTSNPQIINVDDQRDGDIFPSRLIKRHRIDRIRPSHRSASYRSAGPPPQQAPPQQVRPPPQVVPPINVHPSLARSEVPRVRQHQLSPPQVSQRVIRQQSPPAVRERIKVVQPPPLYIKAPPPKVMVVDRPRYVPTPPKIIR